MKKHLTQCQCYWCNLDGGIPCEVVNKPSEHVNIYINKTRPSDSKSARSHVHNTQVCSDSSYNSFVSVFKLATAEQEHNGGSTHYTLNSTMASSDTSVSGGNLETDTKECNRQ